MIAVTAVLATVALPQVLSDVDRIRTAGAARHLASRFSLARTLAVARGSYVGVVLTSDETGIFLETFRDGNANGMRMADVASGVDAPIEPPVRLTDLFPGVTLSINNPALPLAPGSAMLVSFSQLGTATSTTVYLRGRDSSQYAVRVLGATGRTRLLRYLAPKDQWVPVF